MLVHGLVDSDGLVNAVRSIAVGIEVGGSLGEYFAAPLGEFILLHLD
jgi:hypothetical protein